MDKRKIEKAERKRTEKLIFGCGFFLIFISLIIGLTVVSINRDQLAETNTILLNELDICNGYVSSIEDVKNIIEFYHKIMAVTGGADSYRIAKKISILNRRLNEETLIEYAHLITECTNNYNLDEDILISMMKLESNFDPNAVSETGALGLMQIIPGIWCDMLGLKKKQLFDPAINIYAGCWILNYYKKKYPRTYLERYGGEPPETDNYRIKLYKYLPKIKWMGEK